MEYGGMWNVVNNFLGSDIGQSLLSVFLISFTSSISTIFFTYYFNHILNQVGLNQSRIKQLSLICQFLVSCLCSLFITFVFKFSIFIEYYNSIKNIAIFFVGIYSLATILLTLGISTLFYKIFLRWVDKFFDILMLKMKVKEMQLLVEKNSLDETINLQIMKSLNGQEVDNNDKT